MKQSFIPSQLLYFLEISKQKNCQVLHSFRQKGSKKVEIFLICSRIVHFLNFQYYCEVRKLKNTVILYLDLQWFLIIERNQFEGILLIIYALLIVPNNFSSIYRELIFCSIYFKNYRHFNFMNLILSHFLPSSHTHFSINNYVFLGPIIKIISFIKSYGIFPGKYFLLQFL